MHLELCITKDIIRNEIVITHKLLIYEKGFIYSKGFEHAIISIKINF